MSLSAIGFSLSALVSLGIASRHIWHGPHVKFSFSFRFKQFLSFRFIFCQIFIDSHISANIFTFFFHSTQVLIYSFFFCKSIFLFIILLIFLFSFCSEQCIFYKLVFLFSNIFLWPNVNFSLLRNLRLSVRTLPLSLQGGRSCAKAQRAFAKKF